MTYREFKRRHLYCPADLRIIRIVKRLDKSNPILLTFDIIVTQSCEKGMFILVYFPVALQRIFRRCHPFNVQICAQCSKTF